MDVSFPRRKASPALALMTASSRREDAGREARTALFYFPARAAVTLALSAFSLFLSSFPLQTSNVENFNRPDVSSPSERSPRPPSPPGRSADALLRFAPEKHRGNSVSR